MPCCNKVFFQMLKLAPKHEFKVFTKLHRSVCPSSVLHPDFQFVALAMAQLAGRISLYGIVKNVSVQTYRLYHLGSEKLTRSNLPHTNEDNLYALYGAPAGKLLNRCQGMTPDLKFRFKSPLYS